MWQIFGIVEASSFPTLKSVPHHPPQEAGQGMKREARVLRGGERAGRGRQLCFHHVFSFQLSCGIQRGRIALKLLQVNTPFPTNGRNRQLDLGDLRSGQHRPLLRLQVFLLLGMSACCKSQSGPRGKSQRTGVGGRAVQLEAWSGSPFH